MASAGGRGGVGTFTCDIGSNVLQVTPEFCRLFGVPVCETIPAANIEALVVEEDRIRASTAEGRRLSEAAPVTEYRIRHAVTGSIRWIARSAAYERDASGRAASMVGVVQDVTDRKAALLGFAVMGTGAGWGSAFPEMLRNGDWNYAVSTPT